jgi:hypothetical protein
MSPPDLLTCYFHVNILSLQFQNDVESTSSSSMKFTYQVTTFQLTVLECNVENELLL